MPQRIHRRLHQKTPPFALHIHARRRQRGGAQAAEGAGDAHHPFQLQVGQVDAERGVERHADLDQLRIYVVTLVCQAVGQGRQAGPVIGEVDRGFDHGAVALDADGDVLDVFQQGLHVIGACPEDGVVDGLFARVVVQQAGLGVIHGVGDLLQRRVGKARAKQLSEGLLALSAKYGMKGERGMGLLRALIMDRDDGPAIVEAARNLAPNGLLLNAPRGNLLRFMPALNVTAEEIDTMLTQLDGLIAQVRKV